LNQPARTVAKNNISNLYTLLVLELIILNYKDTYQGFFSTLIDLIIGFLVLIIKTFDNQTEIFRDLGLIINPFDNQAF
jgi:hypothetical protein